MNRFSGFWWSPDSQRIAYQETDASQVESWYVADPAKPGGEPSRTFYPRPGKNNVNVRLGVTFVDVPGETVWLDWDHKKYSYLGKVTWTEHGPLTLTVLSRDQTDLALMKADPTWGDTTLLLTEHDDAWVNLPQDVPVWLSEDDGGGFLWASERSGWRALERRSADGRPGQVLTESSYKDRITLDERRTNFRALQGVANGRAFTVCSETDPSRQMVRVIPLNDEARSPLHNEFDRIEYSEPGVYKVAVGGSQTVVAVTGETTNSMPQTTVWPTNGGRRSALYPLQLSNPHSYRIHGGPPPRR